MTNLWRKEKNRNVAVKENDLPEIFLLAVFVSFVDFTYLERAPE